MNDFRMCTARLRTGDATFHASTKGYTDPVKRVFLQRCVRWGIRNVRAASKDAGKGIFIRPGPRLRNKRSYIENERKPSLSEFELEMEDAADKGDVVSVLHIWDTIGIKGLKSTRAEDVLRLLEKAEVRSKYDMIKELYDHLAAITDRIREAQMSSSSHRRAEARNVIAIPKCPVPKNLGRYLSLLRLMMANRSENFNPLLLQLFQAFCNKRDIELAHDIILLMREQRVRLNIDTYTKVFAAASAIMKSRSGDMLLKKCENLLRCMEEDGIEPDLQFYNVQIKFYAKRGRLEEAENVLNKIRTKKIQLECSTYNPLFHGYAIATTPETALEMVERFQKTLDRMEDGGIEADLVTFNAFLNTCSKGGLLEKAMLLYAEMSQRGIRPDVVSYTTLLDAFAASTHPANAEHLYQKCQKFLRDMKKANVKPNARTYNSLLKLCGRGKMLNEAIKVFQELEESGFLPTIVSYTALIHTYSQCTTPDNVKEMWGKCRELLDKWLSGSEKPDILMFNAFINVSSQGGWIEKSVETIHEIEQRGLKPIIITYTTLLYTYVRAVKMSARNDAFQWRQANSNEIAVDGKIGRTPPTSSEVTARRTAYLNRGILHGNEDEVDEEVAYNMMDWFLNTDVYESDPAREKGLEYYRQCQSFLDKMRTDKTYPENSVYGAVMRLCKEGGLVKEVTAVLGDMISEGLRPDSSIYSIVIDTIARSVVPETAKEAYIHSRKLVEDLKQDGTELDNYVLRSLLNVCRHGQLVEEAIELFEEFKLSGVEPNNISYNTLLAVYAGVVTPQNAAGIYQTCREIIAEMESVGITPVQWTYNALLRVCSNGKLLDEAIEAFKEIERSPSDADCLTYSTLISTYGQAATVETAMDAYRNCRDLLDKMEAEGVYPILYTYAAIMNLCANGHLLEELAQMFDEIELKGLCTDRYHYATLINGLAETTKFNPPESDIVEDMVQTVFNNMERKGMKPLSEMYANLQKLYGVRGEIEKAIDVFDEMKRKGTKPCSFSFYICFKYLILAGKEEYAPRIREKMRESGFTFEDVPFKVKTLMRKLNINS